MRERLARRKKHLVTALLIAVAAAAVGLASLGGRPAQAQYCNNPCDPYCWGT